MADDVHGDLTLLSWELDDGEAVNREAPATFPIPPESRRRSLANGDVVKLIFRMLLRDARTATEQVKVERMWVIVAGRDDLGYNGILDNDPYCTRDLRSGAPLSFEPRHVIQIYETDTKSAAEQGIGPDGRGSR